MLNDQTPVDKFDVTGPFEFKDQVLLLDEFHTIAEAARPDLKAAVQAIDKAQTDHKLAVANGSTDPTFGMDFARNPPIPLYVGFSVNIPLRIFDRNQGEKARTQIDITHAERQKDAAQAQVFSDVDSAYFTLISSVNLLKPYQGPTATCRPPPASATPCLSRICAARRAAGLSGRAARLPRHRGRLHQSGGRLPDRGQPVESGGRPRSGAVARGRSSACVFTSRR